MGIQLLGANEEREDYFSGTCTLAGLDAFRSAHDIGEHKRRSSSANPKKVRGYAISNKREQASKKVILKQVREAYPITIGML